MPRRKEIEKIFSQFNSIKALIIGDAMVDAYVVGKVERISPEAPVPVVLVNENQTRLGGSANVAANIKSLGATPLLISIIGDDADGKKLISMLDQLEIESNLLVVDPNRKTTSKTRILASNLQMLRLDNEDTHAISKETEGVLLDRIKSIIDSDNPHVCIFQDYNKGMLTEKIIRETTMWCLKKNIPVAVDPKKNNFFAYQLCTLYKPNLREIKESLHIQINPDDIDSLNEAASVLHKHLHNGITLITLGEKGVYLRSGNDVFIKAAHIRNVADVSGAGDTVISIAALCLAAKAPLDLLASLSNLAGGIVCEYPGVVSINRENLLEEALQVL